MNPNKQQPRDTDPLQKWTSDDVIKIIGDSTRTDVIIQKLKHAHNAALEKAVADAVLQCSQDRTATGIASKVEMIALQRLQQQQPRCTCDNANGLHWGNCPVNMKQQPRGELK